MEKVAVLLTYVTVCKVVLPAELPCDTPANAVKGQEELCLIGLNAVQVCVNVAKGQSGALLSAQVVLGEGARLPSSASTTCMHNSPSSAEAAP